MMRAIGIMSGTSLDGIDVADVDVVVEPDEHGRLRATLRRFATLPISASLRDAISAALPPHQASAEAIGALDVALGEAFADAVLRCARDFAVGLEAVDVIGSHGQTVYHSGQEGVTLQLGRPAIIAARTGVTCVGDFRSADLAAGGQGAPLVPYFDAHLLRHTSEHRAVVNIGGMANVTLLPAGHESGDADVTASDTGPGNVLIDECVRMASGGAATCDENGRIAAEGTISDGLLRELLDEPYFARAWPKSTGREHFGSPFAARTWERGLTLGLKPADIVATVTALSARTIADAIPTTTDRVIVSGGGVRNATLLAGIRARLRERGCRASIEASDEHGIPADAKEAIAFAVFGALAVHGIAANMPPCTGARRRVVLGAISPGKNFSALMRRIHTP